MPRAGLALLLVSAALLAAAPAASAQGGNPFDGLPPAPPPPAPTAEPVSGSGGDLTRETMWIIGGALLITFVAIGFWISRDARRNLPPGERDDPQRPRDAGPHKHERRAKAKARAKGRAQRQARKAARRARR